MASAKAIKTYIDTEVTAQDLDFQADTGGALSIDLDSETLSVVGTSNEIETAGSGNQIQIGLPNEVEITTSLVVGSATTINAAGIIAGIVTATTFSGGLATSDVTGTITNAQLAGSIENGKLSNSTITVSDGSNSTATALGGTITFSGTSSEVEVAESSGTITVGLPNDVSITGDLTVGTKTVIGTETASLTTTSQTSIHAGLSASTYRSVEYTIQATEGTNFHATKILALHNGTTAYHSEYGTIYNSSSVATFDVDVNGGNLRLLATGASANTTNYTINFVATKI